MALNIKDPETDRLARELASLAGQPITAAVRDAIVDRIATLRRRKDAESLSDLAGIIARGRARRIVDDRSDDEILGYGEDGLPR